MVKFPLAALVAIVCLALAGLATPIALGAAEKGTLRIQFMGKSFQELDVSRVQAGLKGVDRRWTTPKKTPDQDIVAEAPAGTRMLTLFVEGRFSFEVDVGPVTIKPSKETAKQINLSHYMGAIRFEAADHSLFNKALVWLYPDRDKWHFAFGKDHIPEDGVVNYVPGARMWMVVTDGGKTPLAAQWIRVFPKRQITVQLKKLHQDIKLPVQVRLRTDSVKESDLSFQLLGSRSQDFKQSTASGFYTEVQPGFYNIRVKNKDMEHSSVDFFVMDAPVEMLLVVDGPEKVRFCSSQAMKRAKHLFNKGERLTKASRLEDAILFYDRADTCLINDRAQRKATELGEQLAARAEKAKRYRGNGFLYYSSLKEERCEEAPDMYPPKQGGVCLFNQFIVSNPKAGAIEWLTAVE
ncbi:MAG: hypothetical protein ACE5IR_23790, partial [bacterium]